jgi:hypothetical protein
MITSTKVDFDDAGTIKEIRGGRWIDFSPATRLDVTPTRPYTPFPFALYPILSSRGRMMERDPILVYGPRTIRFADRVSEFRIAPLMGTSTSSLIVTVGDDGDELVARPSVADDNGSSPVSLLAAESGVYPSVLKTLTGEPDLNGKFRLGVLQHVFNGSSWVRANNVEPAVQLFDSTASNGAALDTGILDVSRFREVLLVFETDDTAARGQNIHSLRDDGSIGHNRIANTAVIGNWSCCSWGHVSNQGPAILYGPRAKRVRAAIAAGTAGKFLRATCWGFP